MRLKKYYISQLKAEIAYLPKNLGYLFSSKKKAIYIGCTGQGNLGDEGVYCAIQNLLRDKIFLYPILYAKPSSGKYLRNIFVRNSDLIILGGGTMIKKKTSESYLKLILEYHHKFPKAKVIVFGCGVADPILAEQIGFPTDIAAWKSILDKCQYIGVRGPISKNILKNEWNVTPSVSILHDPAIFFTKRRIKSKQKQKRIGLNFCDIFSRIYGLDQNKVTIFAKQLIERLISENWNVVLYPTAKNDIFYMQTIIGNKLISKVEMYENYRNLESSLSFLENLDVFVGQRLHSIIFAAATFTPFHAIEYESKTSDFLQSVRLEDYSTRTDNLDVNKIIEKINFLYNNSDEEQFKLYKLISYASLEQRSISKLFLNKL
jgi:polysaccharide pyruvyl transferase WcaK-like protein